MPRLLLMLAMLTAALAAAAEDMPARRPVQAYLFGQPRLLTQQLIWGLAHGVKLLATACGEGDAPTAKAYAEWRERQHRRIEAADRDLSQHYFGQESAGDDALTAAMHLKPALDERPDEIAAACTTFAKAIATERYDLELFYRLRRDAARVERAEAVRSRVATCLKRLPAEPAAALTAQFAVWRQANDMFESVARSRLLAHDGDRLWQHDSGGGSQPPAVACEQLSAALAEPGFALNNVFEDDEP